MMNLQMALNKYVIFSFFFWHPCNEFHGIQENYINNLLLFKTHKRTIKTVSFKVSSKNKKSYRFFICQK